jgi:hypothetical protein
MFVSLPGKTKEEAFKIGHDIADKVTMMNPKPIKLKFEKVWPANRKIWLSLFIWVFPAGLSPLCP